MSRSGRKTREPLEVVIDELHPDGYGLADSGRLGVTGALPGETITARPFTRRRRRLFAKTEAVVDPHPDRVVPICAAADYCGGCSLQHLDPARQIANKQAMLAAELGDIRPTTWLAPLRGPVSHYRSKARLGVKYVRNKERVLVGFREQMSPYVADIVRCEVLVPPFDALIEPLAALVESLSIAASVPQIEVAGGDDRAALVFRHLEALSAGDRDKLLAFSRTFGIDVYLQPSGLDSVHKLAPEDAPRLHYGLPQHGIEMAFHPMDFTQVNQPVNRRLVDRVIDLLELESSHSVLDLFCGIGNFTLPIARRAGRVHGIELSPESVDRARENAARNDIENATFETGDLFDSVRLPEDLPDRVLLDPPRSGAGTVCEALAQREVKRVVYVSCNPKTLANDVRLLNGNGYRLEYAGVVDMFPHTTHVESIACLSKA